MVQTLSIITALIMVGVLAGSINSTRLAKDDAVYEAQAIITGNTLAESVMTEVLTKRFDENAASGITDSTQFTAVGSLGCEAGESQSNTTTLDDIDDYRGYVSTVASQMGTFRVQCSVYYVTAAQLDSPSTVPSFMKRVDVTVKNRYMPNPVDSSLTVSRIVSYR
jgi:hypothetical protein